MPARRHHQRQRYRRDRELVARASPARAQELEQRPPREEAEVRAVQDAAIGVVEAADEERQAHPEVRDVGHRDDHGAPGGEGPVQRRAAPQRDRSGARARRRRRSRRRGRASSGGADSRSATTTSSQRPRARAASSGSRSSAVTLQPWAVSRSARKPSAAPTSRARRPRPSPSRARMTEWLECGSSLRRYVMFRADGARSPRPFPLVRRQDSTGRAHGPFGIGPLR